LREWFKPLPPASPGNRDSWKKGAAYRPSQAIALAVHAGVVILIFFPLRRLPGGPEPPATKAFIVPLDISEFPITLPPGNDEARGGGGGGDRSPLPARKGRLPKFMTTQFAPPSIPRNEKPILVAEASLIGPPDLQFPSPNLNIDGNPLAKVINDSGGPGNGGGMGDGEGTGIGRGHGPGFGPGGNGGWGGGDVFRPGSKGVGFPTCVYCPYAKYPEEARKAKFQGVVQLEVIVLPDGRATDIQVVRGPGFGLDEQAVAAVKTWRFKPALGPNRVPVPTQIIIEVQFRLL
jgi:periplasmic protein TonB